MVRNEKERKQSYFDAILSHYLIQILRLELIAEHNHWMLMLHIHQIFIDIWKIIWECITSYELDKFMIQNFSEKFRIRYSIINKGYLHAIGGSIKFQCSCLIKVGAINTLPLEENIYAKLPRKV